MSRDLDQPFKSAFVLYHKMREAMVEVLKSRKVGGTGNVCETDGAYFDRYVKPAHLCEDRGDSRIWKNQPGKRECVIIVREPDGNSVRAVARSESSAESSIRSRVQKDTILNVDEAQSRNDLHGHFEMKRINYQEAYSLDGACTCRELFQPVASRRSWPSPPRRRSVLVPLPTRSLMA